MSKSRRLLLGILSVLPMILLVVYIFTFFTFIIHILKHAQQEDIMPDMMLGNIAWMIIVVLLLAVSSLALLIYFIIHVINNKTVDSTERIIWVLIFIFAGMVGFPVYWYMRIWKEEGRIADV